MGDQYEYPDARKALLELGPPHWAHVASGKYKAVVANVTLRVELHEWSDEWVVSINDRELDFARTAKKAKERAINYLYRKEEG